MELTGLEVGYDEGRLSEGEELHAWEGVSEAALAVGVEARLPVEQDDGEGRVIMVRVVLGPVVPVDRGGGLVGQVEGQVECVVLGLAGGAVGDPGVAFGG